MSESQSTSAALLAMRTEPFRYGTWLSSGSVVATELASLIGFDWLLLDMEHGNVSGPDILAHLQAIRHDSVAAIVRVPTHDAGLIGRVLDKGATGIMAPHVSNGEQAEAIVRAMQYPPRGSRGVSRTVRALGYGLSVPDDALSTPVPLLMVQIEDWRGVQNAEAIASVDGVDVLFVGPADLKHDLSHRGEEAASYEEALQAVNAAAQKHGKHTGILLRESQEVTVMCQLGFSRTALNSDIGILRAGFTNALTSLQRDN